MFYLILVNNLGGINLFYFFVDFSAGAWFNCNLIPFNYPTTIRMKIANLMLL